MWVRNLGRVIDDFYNAVTSDDERRAEERILYWFLFSYELPQHSLNLTKLVLQIFLAAVRVRENARKALSGSSRNERLDKSIQSFSAL